MNIPHSPAQRLQHLRGMVGALAQINHDAVSVGALYAKGREFVRHVLEDAEALRGRVHLGCEGDIWT